MRSFEQEIKEVLSAQGSISSWERGRLVRIEREARRVIQRNLEKGACFARCADETYAPSVILTNRIETGASLSVEAIGGGASPRATRLI